MFACSLACSQPIKKSVGSVIVVSAKNSWYDFKAASGTPIKFTKSFQAKAMAREKVPMRTIILNTFTFNSSSISKTINQAIAVSERNTTRLLLIHVIRSLILGNAEPLSHLARIKCVIAVIAIAPSIALQYFGLL